MVINMRFIGKIQNRIHTYYRQQVVREQYPMLTSLSRKEWQARGALGVVYMLHHITPKNPKGIPTNEDLKVSPAFLEYIILKYKKAGFQFFSLNDLGEVIKSDAIPQRPFIVFTIDDGYADNYTQALPIFEKYKVPFSIFIATDFINHNSILWWDILEDLITQNTTIHFSNNIYPTYSFQEKWDTFRIIREKILGYDQNNLLIDLQDAFSHYTIDWYAPVKKQAMSWAQVKELSDHPLCTIGGHTVSHPVLNTLNEVDFCHEIADGVAILKEKTGHDIFHFAYPYGSPSEIGEREYKLIKNFNFKTVFSSYGGCITKDNKSYKTHLPRVYLHE